MGEAEASRRPNIVVFFTDQQRWDTVGAAGNPAGLTPNLDAMSRRGTMFDTAIVPNPVCAPSRSAVLCGRYPTETGVWRNGEVLPREVPTLARAFKEASYRTGYIGKWHLSAHEPVPLEERGDFDVWLGANLLEFTSDAYRTVVFDREDRPVELPGYRADALTDAAIRFIAESSTSDQPFFLFVSLIEPHHQNEHDDHPAPEVYRGTFADAWTPPDLAALGGTSAGDLPGYYGQVKRLDECMGRLRDALLSLDLSDSTLVAYTSDHGSHFKTRNSEYKRSVHDASIRVPLLIEGPGVIRGRREPHPVSTAALAPTLLHAAGLDDHTRTMTEPLPLTAADLAAAPPAGEGVLVQISESGTGRAVRTDRWTYSVVGEGNHSSCPSYREDGLWDLHADPYQLVNLVELSGFATAKAQLRALLVSLIEEVEGHTVVIEPLPEDDSGSRGATTTVRQLGLRGERFGFQPVRHQEVASPPGVGPQ